MKTLFFTIFLLILSCPSIYSQTTKETKADREFVEELAEEEEQRLSRNDKAINYYQRHIEEFTNYYEVSFGALCGITSGTVSQFDNAGGGIDIRLNQTVKKRFVLGMNMMIAGLNKKEDFPIPDGYEHYEMPVLVHIGLHTGYQLTKSNRSPLFLNLDFNYSWLPYRKEINNPKNYGGAGGFAPTFELAKSFRIGKVKYSDNEYMGGYYYSYSRYNPNLSLQYLEFFVNYSPLFLDKEETSGGLFGFGIRYKWKSYPIQKNLPLKERDEVTEESEENEP